VNEKEHLVLVSDAEARLMLSGNLECPAVFKSPSGFHYCLAEQYRAWRAFKAETGEKQS
jgi:hypothetical protein